MVTTRRQLLQTVGAGVTGSVLAGCFSDSTDEEEPPALDTESNYRGWFDGVSNYRETLDYRGENRVPVRVGVAGDVGYYKFGPPAIAVSPETTIVWEWTGRGGAHNVVAEEGAFDSGDAVDGDGRTFTQQLERPAIYKYRCEPHNGLGMRGAVFVAIE